MFLPESCSSARMQQGRELLAGGSATASMPCSLWKYLSEQTHYALVATSSVRIHHGTHRAAYKCMGHAADAATEKHAEAALPVPRTSRDLVKAGRPPVTFTSSGFTNNK